MYFHNQKYIQAFISYYISFGFQTQFPYLHDIIEVDFSL